MLLRCLAILVVTQSIPAWGMDAFEYQVYDAEIDKVGEYSLETHVNFSGAQEEAGEETVKLSPNHLTHLTFEFARGMTEWWELGAYLQTTFDSQQVYRYAGTKLRTKFVVPGRFSKHWHFGINFELSDVPPQFEVDRWAMEVRPIISYTLKRWIFTLNPIVDVSLTPGSSASPDFAPAAKITFNTLDGYGLGLEYYADLGEASDLGPIGQAEQYFLLAYDLLSGPVELNVGGGPGLNGESNQWLAKVIFGFDF